MLLVREYRSNTRNFQSGQVGFIQYCLSQFILKNISRVIHNTISYPMLKGFESTNFQSIGSLDKLDSSDIVGTYFQEMIYNKCYHPYSHL